MTGEGTGEGAGEEAANRTGAGAEAAASITTAISFESRRHVDDDFITQKQHATIIVSQIASLNLLHS